MFEVHALVQEIETLSGSKLKSELVACPDSLEVRQFAPLDATTPEDIAFLVPGHAIASLETCTAAVIVMTPTDAKTHFGDAPKRPLVLTSNPYAWFAYALQIMTRRRANTGVDPRAIVSPNALVHPSARIDAGAIIEAGAQVGQGAHIYSGAYVGERAKIGANSILYANVSIYHDCVIGKNVIIHSGAVIGADGFGFAPLAGTWVKIPQVGSVRIEDDVEIGANTTVDRGALQDTVIGKNAKLDNQIQIAHNVRIGESTAMAACTGVAGSTTIGAHCMIGGASSINGHIRIPDCVQIGASSNIMRWSEGADAMMGFFPAMPRKQFERVAVLLRRLTDFRTKIQSLEERLAALEPTKQPK